MENYTMFKIQRETLGITQKQLADEIGVGVTQISQYENGYILSDKILEKIQSGIISVRDRIYPERTYERIVYTLNLHTALYNVSETINDRMRFANKITRDISYIMEYLQKEQNERERNRRQYGGNWGRR